MSTFAIGDLLKASPVTFRIPHDHCSNCGAYLHEQKGWVELCPKCNRILEPEMQIWECFRCETARVYGMGFAYDLSAKKLNCIGCGQLTEHHFSHVNGSGGSKKL